MAEEKYWYNCNGNVVYTSPNNLWQYEDYEAGIT